MQQTAFKQVQDNAKASVITSLSSTGVTSITLAPSQGALLPQPGNGFWATLWNNVLYPGNPGADPNMEKVVCTARSVDVLTITPTTAVHSSNCTIALLDVAQNTIDLQTAVNSLENAKLYNVKDYEAKGDGSTDDSAAFNRAISDATSAGGTLLIPDSSAPYMLNPTTLSNITTNFVGQSISGVTLKLVGGYNTSQDMIRVVSSSKLVVGNFTVDGNKASQISGTNYGLFVSGTTDCVIYNVRAQNFSGVGIHFYNNTRLCSDNTFATGNSYHGMEFEQNSKGTYANIHSYSNTLHGVLVDPGEVGGTGSHSNTFTNVECDGNGQYGLAFNAANGDVSAWLSEGDVFNCVSLTNNSQYGLNIYKQDKQVFNGLYAANNGFFGVYLFESQYNTFNGILLHNNSQASNGSYDEILVEGYSSNSSHPSKGNVFSSGQILIDGGIKARYCFNEGTANDGPNTFVNINTPNAGTAGTVNQLCPSDIRSSPGGVVQIGDNGQTIQGANAGFDSAFSHVLRLYNNFTSGVTQHVNPNGHDEFWEGGVHVLDVTSTGMNAQDLKIQNVANGIVSSDVATVGQIPSVPGVTVSPIGLTTSGVELPNNGANFGPDTSGTTTCGIQEALNSLPTCTVNQKSGGGAYTVSGRYGRLQLTSDVYNISSLITIPAGSIFIDGSGMSTWIPPNNIGLTQASGGTVIASTSYSTGLMTVNFDTSNNPATMLVMRNLDLRMLSPSVAQTTSTPPILGLDGWKSGEISNVNVVECPATPGVVGSNLYKIIDCSPGGSKDTTNLINVRGFGGNIAVTLAGAHITAIAVTGGQTSSSITANSTGILINQNLGCHFANLHGFSTKYGLTFESYFGRPYTPMVIYGCMFEAVAHYLNYTVNSTGTLIIHNPCWNEPSLNAVTDVASTMAGGPTVLTKYEQDETADTYQAMHIAPAPVSTPSTGTPSVVHSAQTTASLFNSFPITSATAGNLLVAIVSTNTVTLPTGTDNVSGTTGWTTSSTFANQSTSQNTFLMYKVAVGGETSINTVADNITSIIYWEIANMGASPSIDAIVATTNGAGITTLTGGSLTTSKANDIVLVGVGGVNTFGTVNAWTDTNAGVPTLVSAAGNTDGGSYIPGSTLTAATFTANWTTSRTASGMITVALTPSAPSLTPYFTAQPYDQIFVITGVGGLTALSLDGQALFNGSFSVGQQVYVGAGHTLTPTWSGTAPTFKILAQ